MTTGAKRGRMYQDLAESLRRTIASGQVPPGGMLASEHDLARSEKVSRVTVRRATDELIREGLLERRPGKGLFVRAAQPATTLVQVVTANLAWEPCLQAARGVQAAARGAGVQVQIYDAHGSEEADLAMIRGLPDGPAQGAVIVSLHGPAFSRSLYELIQRGYPFVLVDQRLRDYPVPSVVADNQGGGNQVGRRLIGLGHRRIAFVGDLESDTVQARLDGLRDAVGDARLPFDRGLVADVTPERRLVDWTPMVIARVRALLERPEPPTAVFASCDAVARAVYAAAQALGRLVPDQLSVVGFDDDPLAQHLAPPLTSVRQPFESMGRAAFALLQARIADPAVAAEHRVLPVELVARSSDARLSVA